jgi:hypothetical protein
MQNSLPLNTERYRKRAMNPLDERYMRRAIEIMRHA